MDASGRDVKIDAYAREDLAATDRTLSSKRTTAVGWPSCRRSRHVDKALEPLSHRSPSSLREHGLGS